MATIKQKRAVILLAENSRLSVGEAMREAGYSKIVSTSPQRLTDSEGYKELTKQIFPDEKLAQVNNELLDHEDWQAKSAGLDKAYKIRGLYSPVKQDIVSGGESISDLYEAMMERRKAAKEGEEKEQESNIPEQAE